MVFLLFRQFFGKGQGHGIKQHRTDVEEMTIQQCCAQQSAQADRQKGMLPGTAVPEQLNRPYPVDQIGCNAHCTAGCKHLYQRVMPAGWEEGRKRIQVRPIPGDIAALGEEAAAKHRLRQELRNAIMEQVVPLGYIIQLRNK